MSAPLGVFERWLSLWVALCIAAGIGLAARFLSCSLRSPRSRSPA